MDWQAMIGRHHTALKRVVAVLVAMVGAGPEAAAGRPTLARHRHRVLLGLVRPAEAAARRLIIVLALALPARAETADAGKPDVATPQVRPSRKRRHFMPIQPKGSPAIPANGVGMVMPAPETPPRSLRLPLADPVRRLRVKRVAARDAPRIWAPGGPEPHRRPPPLRPDDRLDATRLVLRVRAVAGALDDLPREARRFARWRERRAAERARDRSFENSGHPAGIGAEAARQERARAARRFRRVSPLRAGRPPGGRRRPTHEVHAILADVHGLAFDLLARRDTS